VSLADYYRRQLAWRSWEIVLDALPPLRDRTILDLGCGVGDVAAALAARGARVVGVDLSDELLDAARARAIPRAEFLHADLRAPLALDGEFDGLWSSFAAAYFTELTTALASWRASLKPGGWIALTEIDDLLGHEPLAAEIRALFESYAREALAADRYDFHMGRKLADHLARAGFTVTGTLTLPDRELAFDGPAGADVVEAWRTRLDGMKLLHDHCGPAFPAFREEFLACLARADHRSRARVCCALAVR
jgi:SAM-dependent methyltransferase